MQYIKWTIILVSIQGCSSSLQYGDDFNLQRRNKGVYALPKESRRLSSQLWESFSQQFDSIHDIKSIEVFEGEIITERDVFFSNVFKSVLIVDYDYLTNDIYYEVRADNERSYIDRDSSVVLLNLWSDCNCWDTVFTGFNGPSFLYRSRF